MKKKQVKGILFKPVLDEQGEQVDVFPKIMHIYGYTRHEIDCEVEYEGPTFKVGDWVVRTDDRFNNCPVGTVGQIELLDSTTDNKNLRLKGDNNWLYCDYFRPATPAEIAEATKPKRDWVKIFEDAAEYFWNKANTTDDCICYHLFSFDSPMACYRKPFQQAFFDFARNKSMVIAKDDAWWTRDKYGNSQRALFCRQVASLGNPEIERRMAGGK